MLIWEAACDSEVALGGLNGRDSVSQDDSMTSFIFYTKNKLFCVLAHVFCQ